MTAPGVSGVVVDQIPKNLHLTDGILFLLPRGRIVLPKIAKKIPI